MRARAVRVGRLLVRAALSTAPVRILLVHLRHAPTVVVIERRPPVGVTAVSVVLAASRQQLLDLPVVHARADRELEVLPRDRVPVLVHHHDGQQVARRGEEEAVHVVRHGVADGRAERVEDDLADDEEEDAEADVAQRPAVLQRARHQQDLQHHVHEELDRVQQVQDHEQSDGVGRAQTGPALEGGQGDQERDDEGGGRAESHHPQRQRCPILVQLEPDEAVDHEACDHGGG